MTKIRREDAKDIATVGIGCLLAPILLPFGLAGVLFKEEVIDRFTGERQRINRESEARKKRFEQESHRMKAHESLYVPWTEKVTLILEAIYRENPKIMEKMPIERTTLQRWGASFWDFPQYETRVIENEGRYVFETGPSGETRDTVTQGFSLDDNEGRGYKLADAAKRFAYLTASNIVREDTEVLRECLDTDAFRRSPYQGTYRELSKRIKSTKRKKFIKELKDTVGIDLRAKLKEI